MPGENRRMTAVSRPGTPLGIYRGELDTTPTHTRFARRNRTRLIVAGGSHPRWDCDLGAGSDPASSTRMLPSHRTINLFDVTARCSGHPTARGVNAPGAVVPEGRRVARQTR